MENNIIEDNILTIDSTDSRMKIISIEGNEKQDTREGYNLVNPLAKKNVGNNGVTVDFKENGSIVFNGTSNGLGAWLISDDINYEPGEKYTMIVDIIKGTVTNSEFGWGILIYPYVAENAIKILDTSSGRITNSFTFPNDTEISQKNIYLWFGETEEGATFDDFTIKIMIVKGENVVDKEFELYGAMPSFDYPSEIKTVGDNINLFDDEAYKGFVVTQQNYNALEKIDLKLENNKYYVAKIYFDDGTSVAVNNSNFMLYAYKADGTQSANIPNQIAKSYANATELVKAKIVANATGLSAYANKVIKGIKIEEVADEDGQPSPYSNYGQGCIELNITNKNILDVSKNSTVTKAGMTVSTDKDGILTLNGTTTSAIYIGLNKNNFIMQARNLFERSMFRKGNYNFSVDNLSSTQILNASAYIRKNYNSGEIIYLESVFSAKHRDKNFILEEDKEAIVYLWIASGITLNNAKLKFQIELDNATDIVTNEEQNYVIPVQQRMFKQDKFIKINGVWKEMHSFKEAKLSEVSSWTKTDNSQQSDTILRFTANFSDGKLAKYIRTSPRTFWSDKSECVYLFDAYKKECLAPHNGVAGQLNVFINKNRLLDETVEAFKEYLKNNEIIVYYKLKEPLYLDCTPEQIEVLNKIMYLYNGTSNIYTEDEIAPKIEVEIKKIVEDYDAYISNEGYFIIPEYDIKYLINLNESNIPSMPEATETSIKVAGRDGDVPLNTTYEPISFDLVCYTEDNLSVLEKSENEAKVNLFLNSIKNKTKKFAIERDMKFYDIKYNGSLTRTNYPAHLKFSIPFKSSDSYAKDLKDKMIVGNSSEESNTINNVGALFTIKGPATMPIISLNDYSMEYSTSILEGARIEIDSNKSTITHINSDGVKTNVMKYYNHQFPKIENGINILKVLSGVNNSNQVNVKWRDLKL